MSKKTYTYKKKSANTGFGRISNANGLFKTKMVSGHWKMTTRGFKYISPYARSR